MQFTKTIGHEKQKRLFEQVVKTGRLGHAYAFVGEEGIGKTTFARELAVNLGADPVLDLFSLEDKSSISVEEVRVLVKQLALTPVGKYKVAIINADAVGVECANALLKTLEEPPARSLLILVSTNFYSLLPTIASRVQKVVFGLPSNAEVEILLVVLDLDDEQRERIVKLAGGRIGMAQRLAMDKLFLEFINTCSDYYQSLHLPSLAGRLKAAEQVAAMEPDKIRYFIQKSMRDFVMEPKLPDLGRKLSSAYQDIDSNVNVKLALDNLFL